MVADNHISARYRALHLHYFFLLHLRHRGSDNDPIRALHGWWHLAYCHLRTAEHPINMRPRRLHALVVYSYSDLLCRPRHSFQLDSGLACDFS